MTRLTRMVLIGIPVVFVLIQAVPYGRDHDNPPVVREPKWATEETRALAKRACFACHSNETVWTLPTHVAPFSWLIQYVVTAARDALNFSDWTNCGREDEMREQIRSAMESREMPHWIYRVMHPECRLTDVERKRLVLGLPAPAAP